MKIRNMFKPSGLLVLIMVVALPIAGWAAPKPVVIGLQGPITGPWAYEGQMARQSCEIVAKIINDKGGILNGRPVQVRVVDDEGQPKSGALAATKLCGQKDVVASVSTYGSSICEAAMAIYEKRQKVNIGYGVTAVRLTQKGFNYFFRTCGRDDAQGKFFAKIADEKFHAARIAIMHDNTAFGKGLAEDAKKGLKAAMDSGVWFHTSRMYGDALEVLGQAFSEDPKKKPKLIINIGWDNVDQLRAVIQENLEPLGVGGMQLGQLCLGGELAEDFANGGDCYRVFQDLKDEGLVQGYVLEVFPWTSDAPLRALRAGYTAGMIDGFIFYLNPLQRFASNVLWDEILEREQTIIAMRTVAGGPVHSLRLKQTR